MKLILRFILILAAGVVGCKVNPPQQPPQVAIQDSVKVTQETTTEEDSSIPELRLYRGEQTRHFQLVHTRLEVSFDWEHQHLLGKANLILQPHFYEQSTLRLDAKDFDIHKEAGGQERPVVKEFGGILVRNDLAVSFTPADNSKTNAPLICGIEAVAEDGHE